MASPVETVGEYPPEVPGVTPFGVAGGNGRALASADVAALDQATLALAPAPPPLPAAWRPIADWLSQPAPAFAGAANAVHFYLRNREGFSYQGNLFYKPASPPFHPFISRNRLYGTGCLHPNVPWGERYKAVGSLGDLPAPWVRLVVAFHATGGLAGLTLHQGISSSGLPGPQVGWAEEDISDPGGSGTHYVTNLGPWILYMELTSMLM